MTIYVTTCYYKNRSPKYISPSHTYNKKGNQRWIHNAMYSFFIDLIIMGFFFLCCFGTIDSAQHLQMYYYGI